MININIFDDGILQLTKAWYQNNGKCNEEIATSKIVQFLLYLYFLLLRLTYHLQMSIDLSFDFIAVQSLSRLLQFLQLFFFRFHFIPVLFNDCILVLQPSFIFISETCQARSSQRGSL
jgi:hypothetical protein